MNHQRFLLLNFVIATALLVVSCRGDTGAVPTGEVYYFPEKNAYYDTRTNNFYYSLDSARSWDSLKYTGHDYGTALGARIALDNQPAFPFTGNDSHLKAYNGTLLNFVNSRTRLLARTDSLKKIKAPPVIKSREKEEEQEQGLSEEKPKKGLRKFFDNLFGKKKDKKSE